jgi:hypothetical protein
MLTYKMCFISNIWTSRVINRVVRDVLTSQRLCKVENIRLIVAANRDLQSVLTGLTNVKFTTDLSDCEIYRLYVDKSVAPLPNDPSPESFIPEGVPTYDTITVVPLPKARNLRIEKDPYAGVHLPDRFQRIPSTIDQYMNAPKPTPEDEPEWRPYL